VVEASLQVNLTISVVVVADGNVLTSSSSIKSNGDARRVDSVEIAVTGTPGSSSLG
jgi:hypothetical protein